jgi:competence protein ComEC
MGHHIRDFMSPAWGKLPLFVGLLRLHVIVGACVAALADEYEARRFYLWTPVSGACGVVLYMNAVREPPLSLCVGLWLLALIAVCVVRHHYRALICAFGILAFMTGLLSGSLRNFYVSAPVLARMQIGSVSGFVEQIDFRPKGARILIRVEHIDGLDDAQKPYRVRVTTPYTPSVQAGDFMSFKARLMPPSHASIPHGYDFARDAWFARLGGVGNILGRSLTVQPPPYQAD